MPRRSLRSSRDGQKSRRTKSRAARHAPKRGAKKSAAAQRKPRAAAHPARKRASARSTGTQWQAPIEPAPLASPRTIQESMVDETISESFPASDPPGWTLGHS